MCDEAHSLYPVEPCGHLFCSGVYMLLPNSQPDPLGIRSTGFEAGYTGQPDLQPLVAHDWLRSWSATGLDRF